MVSRAAIRVDGLSKCYRIGAPRRRGRESLVDAIAAALGSPFRSARAVLQGRMPDASDGEVWALRGVSFEVEPGEIIGVIGRNGAGKSTLLKILSRITEPTGGYVGINGRVGSLLEVGTGFHGELTGRDNVYLNGAILGMTRAEIDRKFDEIVAFAEVERFLDTPVKHYSTGMYMRLAFAVAAHLDPDVLLVDEVLAVGDAQFQKKCLGKVEKVSAAGRTVLLVSHNMQAISTLAQRCFLLRGGQLDSMAPRDAIAAYLSEHASRSGRYVGEASAEHPRVTGVEVHTSDPDCVHRHGEPFVVDFEVSTPRPLANAALSLQVCDDLGRPVVHLWTFDSERPWCRRAGGFLARCRIPVFRLYMGRYTLTVHLADGSGAASVQTLEGLCPFEVVMHGHARDFPWRPNACVYLEESEWSVSERPSE